MLSIFTLFASAIAVPPAPPCQPIPGIDAVLEKPDLRWIVVGEIHGTAEIPSSFVDLVCAAGQTHKSLIIGVELPERLQSDIDRFMRASDPVQARSEFARKIKATNPVPDGRTSAAIIDMLVALRPYISSGQVRAVRAIVPKIGGNLRQYELDMAENVKELSHSPATLALVLVGNVHARTASLDSSAPSAVAPMTSQLPAAQTFALSATGWGGDAWNCRGELPDRRPTDAALHCGVFALPAATKKYPRGIVPVNRTQSKFDGYLNIGKYLSASPPDF